MSTVATMTFTIDFITAVPKRKDRTFRRTVFVCVHVLKKAFGSDYETSKMFLVLHMNSESKQYLICKLILLHTYLSQITRQMQM